MIEYLPEVNFQIRVRDIQLAVTTHLSGKKSTADFFAKKSIVFCYGATPTFSDFNNFMKNLNLLE